MLSSLVRQLYDDINKLFWKVSSQKNIFYTQSAPHFFGDIYIITAKLIGIERKVMPIILWSLKQHALTKFSFVPVKIHCSCTSSLV